MSVSCGEFADACNDQGSYLKQQLGQVVNLHESGPARLLVQAAARVLREGREALAYQPLERPVLEPDSVSRILRSIINASINPVSEGHPLYFDQQNPELAAACGAAEGDFAQTLVGMRAGRITKPALQLGGEIFMHRGEAFALRKSEGYSSGLALKEVVIRGIPYPPGSILRIATPENVQGYNQLAADEFVIRPKEDITAIGFTRLSAFASRPDQREEYFDKYTALGTSLEGYELLQTLEIGELQPLVQGTVLALQTMQK